MERIRVLDALEQQAMGLSRMLSTYTDRLQGRLQQRADISLQSNQVSHHSTQTLHHNVAESVQHKQALVESCHRLDRQMAEVSGISDQIRDIKRLLDKLEAKHADGR